MTRSDTAIANGTLAGGGRNGMPEGKLYRYGGERTLADELPDESMAGCGRRVGRRKNLCAVCRGSSGLKTGGREDR